MSFLNIYIISFLLLQKICIRVFNTTFNNISVTLWWFKTSKLFILKYTVYKLLYCITIINLQHSDHVYNIYK